MKGRASWKTKSLSTALDVDANIKDLQMMLDYSGGTMAVPVNVEGDKATVGFGGESGVSFT